MGTPTIDGDLTASINEGDINITSDLDDIGLFTNNTDDIFTITAQELYGTASINSATGAWTYALDNTDPDVIALNPGDTLTDIFTVNMLDTGGLETGEFDTADVTITVNGIICFASGTLIETPVGPQAIETLKTGDICLKEAGDARRIRWIGCREVAESEMLANPKLRPVRITKRALGGGLPS